MWVVDTVDRSSGNVFTALPLIVLIHARYSNFIRFIKIHKNKENSFTDWRLAESSRARTHWYFYVYLRAPGVVSVPDTLSLSLYLILHWAATKALLHLGRLTLLIIIIHFINYCRCDEMFSQFQFQLIRGSFAKIEFICVITNLSLKLMLCSSLHWIKQIVTVNSASNIVVKVR